MSLQMDVDSVQTLLVEERSLALSEYRELGIEDFSAILDRFSDKRGPAMLLKTIAFNQHIVLH
jgi:hypothetical protein